MNNHTGVAGTYEDPSASRDVTEHDGHKSRQLRFVTFDVRNGRAYGPLTIAKEDRMRWMDLLANGDDADRSAVLEAMRESLKP